MRQFLIDMLVVERAPKDGGFSRCVADRFSVYVSFFPFVEVHFFNSETSSLKLSTLTCFEMSLSEASFCCILSTASAGSS